MSNSREAREPYIRPELTNLEYTVDTRVSLADTCKNGTTNNAGGGCNNADGIPGNLCLDFGGS
jgi:hypothetical protein